MSDSLKTRKSEEIAKANYAFQAFEKKKENKKINEKLRIPMAMVFAVPSRRCMR